jgi:hypothetical protein
VKAHFGLLASPPPLPRLAARGLLSCALAMRADLEAHPDREAAAALIALTRDWLERQGFAAEAEAEERAALEAPPGTLDGTARERCSACGEAAALLGWALQRCDLPGFDTDADAAAVAAALGLLEPEGGELATRGRLRSRETLMDLLDAIGAVHWRLLEHTRRPDAQVSMQRFGAAVHRWPEGVVPCELAGDDLAIAGRALRELDPVMLLAALRRVQERHRALLWLLGQNRAYAEVALPG